MSCNRILECYFRYLLGLEPDSPAMDHIKTHIKSCPSCCSNLDLFSGLLERQFSERGLSEGTTCTDAAVLAETVFHDRISGKDRDQALNHLFGCRRCRETFIQSFTQLFESHPDSLSFINNIPDIQSPLLLLELKKKKETVVKEAIRTAEASFIKIKPDGGIRFDLKKIIEKKIESIPPYPDSVKMILELIDIDADLKDIAGEICTDVSLSARILQIANSTFYRGKFPVEDIQRALSRIGLKSISRVVKVFGIHSTVMNQAGNHLNGYNIPMKIFMNYSAMTAIISMLLAPHYDQEYLKASEFSFDIDMVAYTAALVQNLGMIILGHCIDNNMEDRIQAHLKDGMKITEIENSLLGTNHPEVSAKILKKWKLSDNFIHSIVTHHDPVASLKHEDPLSGILYCADTVASRFLRPQSRVRPYLHMIESEENLLEFLPFSSMNEYDNFCRNQIIPTLERHDIMFNRDIFSF